MTQIQRQGESLQDEARRLLEQAVVEFQGRPIGVRASRDRRAKPVNYDQCFVRDFAICTPALLLSGRGDVVKNFLLETAKLQSRESGTDCYSPGRGLMPASFRPVARRDGHAEIDPDYGEESIARVTPVDSVFWWLLTLRAYVHATGDRDFSRREDCRRAVHLILDLVLEMRFELFPTLLVPDGSFMIDRRMGVYGHPLEVQSLFFAALRAADELIEESERAKKAVRRRLGHLVRHIRKYYWIDPERLRTLTKRKVDQYGPDATNILNIFPEIIPDWAGEFIAEETGYLAGNLGPGRLDFRFFAHGNLLAAMSGLASADQAIRILRLYEQRWDRLVADAPLRICYPAFDGEAWRIETGADRRNEAWSYHNGGCWPCLLWAFVPTALRFDRRDLAQEAIRLAERRLSADEWPEYYAGETEARVPEAARRFQSWTMGAYLYAKACLDEPELTGLYCRPEAISDFPE